MLLADLGADVVKVEMPERGDDSRYWGPPFVGDTAAYFLAVNRNKRSITLDLRSPHGRRAADALVANSDVVVENWRPGTAARLGLADADRGRVTPDLCTVRSPVSARTARPGRVTTRSCRVWLAG